MLNLLLLGAALAILQAVVESMFHLHVEEVVPAQEAPVAEVPNMCHLPKEIEVVDMVAEGMKVGAVVAHDLTEINRKVHLLQIVAGATTDSLLPHRDNRSFI